MNFITACFSFFLVASQLDVGQTFTPTTVRTHHHHHQSSSPTLLAASARGCAPYIPPGGPVVSEIKSPDDLKDFVIKDDRPSVIKVYASWCLTCKKFDLRYRKVAGIWGEKHGTAVAEKSKFSDRVRFAQMEYGGKRKLFCIEMRI